MVTDVTQYAVIYRDNNDNSIVAVVMAQVKSADRENAADVARSNIFSIFGREFGQFILFQCTATVIPISGVVTG